MSSLQTKYIFLSISAAAIFLLWGLGLGNGMVLTMLRAWMNGALPDGTPLRTRYSGIPGIDELLSLLVAFFYNLTTDLPSQRLFLIDAYSSLAALAVFQVIEASRAKTASRFVSYPSLVGFLSQCFGAGCVLPVYYWRHLLQSPPRSPTEASIPTADAKAIIPSVALGAVLPAALSLAPLSRWSDTHQIILAIWQCYPLAVSMLQSILTGGGGRPTSARSRKSEDLPYLRAAYLFAFAVSFLGHAYSQLTLLLHFPDSYRELYIPNPYSAVDLRTFATLFLQCDWICIASSSLLWSAFLVAPMSKFGLVQLVFMFFLGGVVIGPGAVVSLALLWRENRLREGNMRKAQ